MKRRCEAVVTKEVEEINKRKPHIDLSPFYSAVHKILEPTVVQSSESDCRLQNLSFKDFQLQLKSFMPAEVWNGVFSSRRSGQTLLGALWDLHDLRQLEIHAGKQRAKDVIEATGLPLKVTDYSKFSWQQLKHWLSQPNTAVLVHVPCHLVIMFGAGESHEGRYRHVLIGRPSGGQSPCGWIPWSEQHIATGETMWSDSVNLFEDEICNEQRGLTMYTEHFVSVVKKTNQTTEIPPPKEYPWWIRGKELICNSCLISEAIGDNQHKETSRNVLIDC